MGNSLRRRDFGAFLYFQEFVLSFTMSPVPNPGLTAEAASFPGFSELRPLRLSQSLLVWPELLLLAHANNEQISWGSNPGALILHSLEALNHSYSKPAGRSHRNPPNIQFSCQQFPLKALCIVGAQ